MKREFVQGHRLLLDSGDHDYNKEVVWYYDMFHNVNSIPLRDISISVDPAINIKADINPFMIRDILNNGRYELSCWFMSYSRELLDVFMQHRLYHLHDLNIQIDEYVDRIEMSFKHTDDVDTLFGFVKHMPFMDSRIEVDMSDSDVYTVSLPYEVEHVVEILHNILYVVKFDDDKYDKKYEYICCPHCYAKKGLLESNANFDLIGAICADDEKCPDCGEELSNGYIIMDELMHPCVSILAKYKSEIYGCCQSHPEIYVPTNRAYIFGSMDSEVYRFIKDEIVNYNNDSDLLPIKIVDGGFSDFDYSIGRVLPDTFVKFDISIYNIKTNPERAFMIGILTGLITKAVSKYEESKK